jgi:hypothetical protein
MKIPPELHDTYKVGFDCNLQVTVGELRALVAELNTFKAPALAATPEPAETLSFEFEHPQDKERRTVTLTKAEVATAMSDELFEKLTALFCQCESVGETNVVDCNCMDYTDDFVLVESTSTPEPAVPRWYNGNAEHTLSNEITISEPVNEDGEPTRYIINQQQLERIQALEYAMAERSGEPVAIINEGDEGLFAEFIYGEDGSPLKRGDKLYRHTSPPVWLQRLQEISKLNGEQ